MGNILVTASHFQTLCQDAIKLLEHNGHRVILNNHDMPYYSFDELAVWAPEIDGAIIGMDQWNEAVFQLAPNLKILARFGVGVDNIDLECQRCGGAGCGHDLKLLARHSSTLSEIDGGGVGANCRPRYSGENCRSVGLWRYRRTGRPEAVRHGCPADGL